MIDIDHFKAINDRFGHDIGDDVLVRVAKACQESKRGTDVVGRIGGEEFALPLPETDIDQANLVAERLRQAVSDHVMTASGTRFSVTVSIGEATGTLSMSSVAALIKLADLGLYEAKSAGRNRIARAKRDILSETKLAAE